MLRTVSLIALALLVVPPAYGAVAGPANSIAIGPEGIVDPADQPYFLWVTLTSAEAHSPGKATDDCGSGMERQDPRETLEALVGPIGSWDPTEYLSLHEIFPQCVATEISVPCPGPICPPPLPARAYAAYDFGTGRFYAEAAAGTGGMALPIAVAMLPETRNAEQEFSIGGNSGASVLADCEQCPTPP